MKAGANERNQELSRLRVNVETFQHEAAAWQEALEANERGANKKVINTFLLEQVVRGEIEAAVRSKYIHTRLTLLNERLLIRFHIHISRRIRSIMERDFPMFL